MVSLAFVIQLNSVVMGMVDANRQQAVVTAAEEKLRKAKAASVPLHRRFRYQARNRR